MERVRLMGWCRRCTPGLQLPAFAAAEAGLFAERGIEVEFVPGAQVPDYSLRGLTARPKALAAGEADFAYSCVAYLLSAQTEARGHLPVRFAAISHQRSPICAVVRADSDLFEPEDLPGARAARWSIPWFIDEYASAMAHMGLEPPVIVDPPYVFDAALKRGEAEVIPSWMDMTVHHERTADFPIRAIALDVPVYTTGLIAADRLSDDLVEAMRDALLAGHQLQLEQPELGLTAFRRKYPDISLELLRANWAVFEPYCRDLVPMDREKWRATIDYAAATNDLPVIAGERMYRPKLLAPALAGSPA